MNFQNLPPIESSKTLLDLAFRRARERSTAKKLTGKWLDIIKRKESTKIDSIKDTLVTKFLAILQSFPKEYDLSSFYVKLMNLTLDYPVYKKSLASVNWGSTNSLGYVNFVSVEEGDYLFTLKNVVNKKSPRPPSHNTSIERILWEDLLYP